MKKLSLIIPAHNEEGSIKNTVLAFHNELKKKKIFHEILVINDNSNDKTEKILKSLSKAIREIRYINNNSPNGFGFAVRKGLVSFTGDYVAVVMADLSDSPKDLIKMYEKAIEGCDCVFGSRFMTGAHVKDYPLHKLILVL